MPISTPDALVSVYSGDSDHFRHVMDHLFFPAIEKAGFEPIPPIAEGSDVIHAEIIRNLEAADIVLCDMSTLNANVFFELGIRTALNKPVCIVKDELTKRVPFDASIINNQDYLSSLNPWSLEGEIDRLSVHIGRSAKRSEHKNTLWKYFGLRTIAHPDSVMKEPDSQLELLTMQVENLAREVRQQSYVPSSPATDREHAFFNGVSNICIRRGVTVLRGAVGGNSAQFTLRTNSRKQAAEVEGEILSYAKHVPIDVEITFDPPHFTSRTS